MSRGNWGEDDHQEALRIDQECADNPRLTAWLAEQKASFEDWSRNHGGGWDFSERSLDRVEALIREQFNSREDLFEQEDSPFTQVAAWYVGEVHSRHRGTEWRCHPNPPEGALWPKQSYVIVPWGRLHEYNDEEYVEYDARPQCTPVDSFSSVLRTTEERQGLVRPDKTLRDELEDYEPNA